MMRRLCTCGIIHRNYSTNIKTKYDTGKSKAEVSKQFALSYKKVKSGLRNSLDNYIEKHMDVIQSFNEKHMKSVGERIKLNLDQETSWREIIKNPIFRTATLRYLHHLMDPEEMKTKISFNARENSQYDVLLKSVKMTDFQKRFYTLMSAYASTIAKGPHGSGKSFALVSSALNMRRAKTRGVGINSLILVKSNEMVFQYKKIVESIIGQIDNSKMKVPNVAQFLYRGSSQEELSQEDLLMDNPCPHILVSTPQRLLDLLSSRGMDFVKVNSLAFIGVDDFDSMVDPDLLLETKNRSPVVTLLDYIIKLQDYKRSHNEPHPQIALLVGESAPEALIDQIKQLTKWFDWNKFASIGKFKENTDLPTFKYIPTDVTVSTVLVDPIERAKNEGDNELVATLRKEKWAIEKSLKAKKVKKNSRKKLEGRLSMIESRLQLETTYEVSMSDMTPFDYSQNPKDWIDQLYISDNDLSYSKHRNQRRNALTSSMKIGEMELLINGFEKLLSSGSCEKWSAGKRVLLVHDDEISSTAVLKYLSLRYPGEDVARLKLDKDWSSFSKPRRRGEPWIYIANISSLPGLTLRGLDSVFVLGTSALKDTSSLALVATRLRPLDGLIPAKKLPIFSRLPCNEASGDNVRGRVFVIASAPAFTDMERNFLERSFIGNGLVRQQSAVGQYEQWCEEDFKRYLSATRIDSFRGSGAVTFSGFDDELKDTKEPTIKDK